MARGDYISREAVMDALLHEQYGYLCEDAIKAIPAADVVEVVRCSECRHRDPEDHKCDCGAMERQGCPFPVDDDYYCSYGERKRRGREMFGWIFADLDTIIDCYSEPQKEETSDDEKQ